MMNKRHSRIVLWLAIALVLLLAIGYSFRPTTVLTDIQQVSKNDLVISVTEEGRTRIHDTYVLSAPVTGNLRRIESEVGDEVTLSDTVVAIIEPIDPAFLDPRTEAQAKADVEATASSQTLAQAQVEQVEAELEFALTELNRMRELRVNNSVSQRELDTAERVYKTTRAELATAQAALQMRVFEHERAKAQLMSPAADQAPVPECDCINITSPVDGKVLTILNKSEGVVQAGTPLVEIGNPRQLEIVVELLSFDAVNVEIGQRAIISNWGGQSDLEGVVSHVEPIGFKKISALGIEEQRVNVIIDFTSDYEQHARLGHGYQVDVTIVLNEIKDVLTLPISALFRENQDWAIYAVVDGEVEKRIVELGQRNNFHAELLSGLEQDESFILHPNDQTVDGAKVKQRETL
ncbi:efflux RND transporter periplasmic adaptor subunit [Ningiella sp. W23]|uniref:efflux RND transporter periplasmic adaptor subunit n=1 Tax=Ningiella sp. W23 TaxID=3023715 RepID=UPI00375815D8